MKIHHFFLALAMINLIIASIVACGDDDDDNDSDSESDDDEGDVNPEADETCDVLLDCGLYGDLGLDIPGDSVTQGSDCWSTVVDNQELLDCVTAAEDCNAVEQCLMEFWHNASGIPLCTLFKWFVNGTCDMSVNDSEGNPIPGDELVEACGNSGESDWCPVACFISISEESGSPRDMDESYCDDWQQCYQDNCQ